MLRPHVFVLGALLLATAGCTGPSESGEPAPGEECLLGGPPRAPPDDRAAFNLTDDHLANHTPLSDLFSSPSRSTSLPCEDGTELMDHLASEGADVAEGAKDYQRNVYLTHDETTLWVSLNVER